jgi:hypothetical protein
MTETPGIYNVRSGGKMYKNAERELSNNPEVCFRLNQALEIIKKYYPESSPTWGVWLPTGDFSGFKIGSIEIEPDIIAVLTIEFEKDWDAEAFPLNPYKLLRIDFSANSTSKDSFLDLTYICVGDKDHNNWLADEPPHPNEIVNMCDELFLALKDLTISAEFM